MARRIWTPKEIKMLLTQYPTTTTPEMCKMLGRSVGSIYSMANVLGITKTEDYLRKHVHVMDPKLGAKTRFKPGQEAHNKGKKMPAHVYAKARRTMFKPGQLPHNTLQDGVIRTRTDKNGTKRPFIRVALGKWVEMKNHVWEQANGPMPKGHCIALKDGNPFNYKLENLECITMAENMQRNTIHNYPEEIKSTIRIVAKLNKNIRKHGEEQA